MELVLSQLFRSAVNKFPDKTAVVCEEVRYTYTAVETRANQIANGLLEFGLKKGDRCAILCSNRLEWLELYFGMAQVGIIAVPINFRFAVPEIEYVLTNSQPKAIIYENTYSEAIRNIKKKISWLDHYICLGNNGKKTSNYEKWLKSNSKSTPKNTGVKETDPFFIGYTSGTTGFPKGAVVTHRDLVLHYLVSSVETGGIRNTDIMLLIMPIFHSNSTWFLQETAISGGTTIIYPSIGFDPEKVLNIIEKEKVTFTSLVPTMLTMILNLPEAAKKKNISSLRMLLSSSAPLMTKTKEAALEYFKDIDLYEGYGSTETGTVTILRPEDQRRKVRSIGRPSIGKEVCLLDQTGKEVPVGEIGELYTKGIGVLLSKYWKNPKGTKDAFRGDWCTVGDMGRQDDEGYFYLEDRKKDMIISGGENVYPTEVENVITKYPHVIEVAVIGIQDELWGEKVHAEIVLNIQGDVAIKEKIIEFCNGKLARYKIPKSISFAKELPKSATGKILRRQVRENYK